MRENFRLVESVVRGEDEQLGVKMESDLSGRNGSWCGQCWHEQWDGDCGGSGSSIEWSVFIECMQSYNSIVYDSAVYDSAVEAHLPSDRYSPQIPPLHTVDSSLAVEVKIGGLPVTGPGVIRATGSLTRSDSNRLMRATAVTARVQTSRWLGIA